jgi:hypothetical protein
MFKKLAKSFFSKEKEVERKLSSVADLLVGDIVTFKNRSELPHFLQGVDAEVTALGCYEYSDENERELTMKTTQGDVFFLSLINDDGERYLSFSKKLVEANITDLFDENSFSDIFEEETFAKDLCLQTEPEPKLAGWFDDHYNQTEKAIKGFYHPDSATPSGKGQEFLSHYCEAKNDNYGLQIEIWEDGDTDVFALCCCSEDLIQDLWPASK